MAIAAVVRPRPDGLRWIAGDGFAMKRRCDGHILHLQSNGSNLSRKRGAAIDHDLLHRHMAGLIGGEKQHRIGDIIRPCDLAERNAELELLGQAGDQPFLAGGIAQHAGKHRRIGGAR
ncbi:hypothetical protein D3C78_1359130 [compost metagenome]